MNEAGIWINKSHFEEKLKGLITLNVWYCWSNQRKHKSPWIITKKDVKDLTLKRITGNIWSVY